MATSSVKDVSLNFRGITALDGIMIGVAESLVSSYMPFIGDSLGLAVALVMLLLVLVVRPSGLLGTRETARV